MDSVDVIDQLRRADPAEQGLPNPLRAEGDLQLILGQRPSRPLRRFMFGAAAAVAAVFALCAVPALSGSSQVAYAATPPSLA